MNALQAYETPCVSDGHRRAFNAPSLFLDGQARVSCHVGRTTPCRSPLRMVCILATMVTLGGRVGVVSAVTRAQISRNIYRIPYADGESVDLGPNDYFEHKGSMDLSASGCVGIVAAGHACSTDADCIFGGTCQSGYCNLACENCKESDQLLACDFVQVAPADGIVCSIIEHFNDGGCSPSAFGAFGNLIIILHANGEASRFLHIKQWSPSFFGIQPGMFVTRGQPIAIEGDVGNTCGSTDDARTGSCLDAQTVPSKACESIFPFIGCEDDSDCNGVCDGGTCDGGVLAGQSCTTTSDCEVECKSTRTFRHNHWNIVRYTGASGVVNPFTCGINGNLWSANTSYIAPCLNSDGNSQSYPATTTLSGASFSGLASSNVRQAHNTITASTVTVTNRASLVLHAGQKVTLLPGFAVSPNAYFRAEIAPPDVTAPSAWPIPAACPCTGAFGFCYEWSDPAEADGIDEVCNPQGPDSTKCRKTCPCLTSGTCAN
ncbi:MAG: M23 family metallopeptidase [Planctomycetes bacterium]|nr:M23 family metallopeptidase [Planctomycetota bacterium]